MDDIPSIIKCPACNRTNGVPSSGKSFDCMFCGARIDMLVYRSPQGRLAGAQAAAPRRPAQPAQGGTAFQPAAAYDPMSEELLHYRWFNPGALWDLLSPLLTAALVVYFFLPMIGDLRPGGVSWIFILVGGAIAINLLFSLGFAVVRLVNSTSLRLQDGKLIARHGPFPLRGALAALDDIDRLAVEARGSANRRARAYQLVLYQNDGRKQVLIPVLRSARDGEVIIEQLASRLALRR